MRNPAAQAPESAHFVRNSGGGTLSHDALERRLSKYSPDAAEHCASLRSKRVTAHVLRHTAAMRLLHAGVDTSVIALWLGHEQVETTQIYLHADLALKERALARTTPTTSKPGRYRPPTRSSPSSRRSDYADLPAAITAAKAALQADVGIIRRSE